MLYRVAFVILITLIFYIIAIIWNPGDRLLEKRKQAMKQCIEVEFLWDGSIGHIPEHSIKIPFESKFFCPLNTFNVYEAMNKAEEFMSSRGIELNLQYNQVGDDVFLKSALGKENNQIHRWVIETSSKNTNKALNQIRLNAPTTIQWYFR